MRSISSRDWMRTAIRLEGMMPVLKIAASRPRAGGSRGVMDAEHRFAKRRLDHLSRKKLQGDLSEPRRLVNGIYGGDIM